MKNHKQLKINYLTPGGALNVYPFKAFRVSCRSYTQFPHTHAYFQIWYVKNGKCIHWINDEEHELHSGDIFILPPDVPHCLTSEGNDVLELFGCEFMGDFILGDNHSKSNIYYEYIEPFLEEKNVRPFFSLEGAVIKEIDKVFEALVREYNDKKPFFELNMRAEFLKLLSIIMREYQREEKVESSSVAKHRKAILEALDYMSEHYNEKIYLEDVCKLLIMSPAYFSSVFKKITGKTFTEQLNSIRVQKAKDLLMDHNKTVGRVAIEVGFTDSAYFDRVSKKEVGVSPGKFRKFL